MDRIVVDEGGVPLEGRVPVSVAKNAALPLLTASLLVDGECRFEGVPALRDVDTLLELLEVLGVGVERNADGSLSTDVENPDAVEAPYEIVKRMRASFCVLGPILARRGRARVSMPGGCNLGVRPVDLHLKGLAALGAEIRIDGGYVDARGPLRGAEVFLIGPNGSTVLGTANVMMAACLAEGRTTIVGAACEPEIADLAEFLVACGARISGIGSPRLVIEGVDRLDGTSWRPIPDRMEAGTLLAAVCATGGDVVLEGADPHHLAAVLDALRTMGARIDAVEGGVRIRGPARPRPIEMTALPYPGFPTDLQAPFTSVAALADGVSVITDKIYTERFMHVPELNRMGANIIKQGASSIVPGVRELSGTEVMASDIRGGASLVVAGLAARGSTTIHRVYHIDRGYQGIERKLALLGARIRREKD